MNKKLLNQQTLANCQAVANEIVNQGSKIQSVTTPTNGGGVENVLEFEVTKPKRGRPRKTETEREKERQNQFELVSKYLNNEYEFRYNALSERVEVRQVGEKWSDFDDRKLNEILTSLHSGNVKVSKDNLNTYINSGIFSRPYNPVVEFIASLKPWNRRTDYIRQVFNYLHLEEGADVEFLFECFKLFFVCFVACAADLEISNQLMLVLEGEDEGTGKTEFIFRLLPPQLKSYITAPKLLTNYQNKDESLATAQNIIFFLDEILLNRHTFNKLKNMVAGAGSKFTNDREAYGHNAKVRTVHASFAATTNHVEFLPEDLGSRRFLVLPVVSSDDYSTMPIEKAYAQAYYLATHPRLYSTRIKPEMMAKLKEINRKYVSDDLCSAILPTILRKPKEGEKGQIALSGEIISWLRDKIGRDEEFSPQKVNSAMRKMGFKPKKTNKGNVFYVKKILPKELEEELKLACKSTT